MANVKNRISTVVELVENSIAVIISCVKFGVNCVSGSVAVGAPGAH